MKNIKCLLAAILCVLSLSCVSYAAEKINLPTFDVTLNGVKIDSATREYPLIVYKDITYFPMTYFDTRFLGVRTVWDGEQNILDIFRENISGAYRGYDFGAVNPAFDEAEVCTFRVYVNGLRIFNQDEEFPLLLYRNVTYFPMTWRFAVDEFGWEYSFDEHNGLVINSDNTPMKRLNFENYGGSGSVATDGKYYYYTGDANNIYRTPVNDLSLKQVIHTMPDNGDYGTSWVQFSRSGDNVFFTYHVGGATMGTTYRYKINSDGSVEKSTEGTFAHSGIGYNGYTIDGDGYTVERYNSGHVGTSVIYYKKDGAEEYTEVKLDGIRFSEYKDLSMKLPEGVENGTWLGSNEEGNTWFSTPVCLGKVLYTTGWDERENKNSDLYRIDLVTGEIKKVLESVCVFHAYYGWDNNISGMTEFVIYDKDSVRYRYSLATGKSLEIDRNVLPMVQATGDYDLAVAGSDGVFSAIYVYDSYGYGSISGERCSFTTPVEFRTIGNSIVGIVYDGTEGGLVVAKGPYGFVNLCENPVDFDHVFVYDNKLMFVVNDPEVMVLELNINSNQE